MSSTEDTQTVPMAIGHKSTLWKRPHSLRWRHKNVAKCKDGFYTSFLASKKVLRCFICQKPVRMRMSV